MEMYLVVTNSHAKKHETDIWEPSAGFWVFYFMDLLLDTSGILI